MTTGTHVRDLPPLPALVPGEVRHQRREGPNHGFAHRAHLWLVDVDDLPHHGPFASFASVDHLGDPSMSLRENVIAFLHAQGEPGDIGRIVMLAAARVAGYVFDPLSVFWCFAPDGELRCVVAEVHNTYGERDAYLLRLDASGATQADKKFYVSPFFDVSGRYEMTFTVQRDAVAVSIDLWRPTCDTDSSDGSGADHSGAGERVCAFSASFAGRPERATLRAVVARSLRQPLMPQRVSALIRAHGIWLWARRLPLVARPEHTPAVGVQPATPDADAHDDGTRDDASLDDDARPPWERIAPAPRGVACAAVAKLAVRYACHVARVVPRFVGSDVARPATPRADGPEGRTSTKSPSARSDRPGIVITHDALTRLARHPKIGLADGYVMGEWWPEDGTDLAALLGAFAARFTDLLPDWAWRLRRFTDERLPGATRNDRAGSRRNVEAHYDLSNDLFAEFLDPTMNYSSALYATGETGLEDAQVAKMNAVLDLAQVGDGTRMLEIGTGWGSLAVLAAQRGAQVTSVTLSREQRAMAFARVADAGLEERVDIRLQDYRDVDGEYDAIVSVEMIEAVGEEFWPAYLATLDARLAPGGRVALQAITMAHERFLATRHSHGWIQEYIFPGGLIPSVRALQDAAREHTTLDLVSHRRFGADYARTLHAWRERFLQRWPAVAELGFSHRFQHLWELYLAYCEAGFATGYLDVEHLLLTRSKGAAS